MHSLIKELISSGPVVTDGAWGTQLQQRGLARGECPELWNLTRPDKVEEVARLYVDAGSRIILTNTFGANEFILGKQDLADRVDEINRAGVEISKRAAGDSALVFASMGPSGRMMITGDVTAEQMLGAFRRQARSIALAGPDGIVVETMMDVQEAKIAAQAAKETGLPVVACMVFDSGKHKDRTMMGNTVEEMVSELTSVGVDCIGSNCGQGIEGFIHICSRMRECTDAPLWMKPNAGLPEIVEGEVVYTTQPEEFARYVPDLVAAGAGFIGGCCGTSGEFIRAIRKVL